MKNLKIKLEFLKLFLLEVEYNNTNKGNENENGKEVIHNDEPIVADQQQ